MFKSEDEIADSLRAAAPKASGDAGSWAQRAAAFFRLEPPARGFPEDLARRLAALARPGVWLETRKVEDEAEIALGATKFGGRPDLPAETSWPLRPTYADAEKRVARYREESEAPDSRWSWATAEQCQTFRDDYAQMMKVVEGPFPLQFLCQIDFAEMWSRGPLDPDFPKWGLLSVFYDVLEMPWGFDPADSAGWVVHFHDQGTEGLARRDFPQELAALDRYQPIAPLSCQGQACLMPLPVGSAVFRDLELTDGLRDLYYDWWWEVIDPEDGAESLWNFHLVGGWPVPIQGDMQTECALVSAGYYCGNADAFRAQDAAAVRATASEWILITQIGSDDKADMMWGDSGNLYVWIRREDLIARRFEAARVVLQCS
ncbi:MAG: YwqG family protein [Kiloniellales bacterium]|nr:YwqG family protein [Kiloniellales bacterium]